MIKKPRLTHLNEKILMVPFRIYEERSKICSQCYAYNEPDGVCKITGAPASSRTRMKAGSCPMGFWSSYYGD